MSEAISRLNSALEHYEIESELGEADIWCHSKRAFPRSMISWMARSDRLELAEAR